MSAAGQDHGGPARPRWSRDRGAFRPRSAQPCGAASMPLPSAARADDVVGDHRRHDAEAHREHAGDARRCWAPGSSTSSASRCGPGRGRCRAGRRALPALLPGTRCAPCRWRSTRRPASEIETFAFFSAIESLIPSPTKQTLHPSFWSLLDVIGLVGGQHLGEVSVHPQ